jgi:hypothetical protein
MESLPSNSHSKQREPSREEPKKIEKVVQGEVVARKKPWNRRMKDTVFQNRADVVADHVFWDVLVPAAKNMIADGATSFIARMIFGEAGNRARSTSIIKGMTTSIGSYGGMQQQTPYHRLGAQQSPNVPPGLSYQARATHDFKELLIPTRVEAEAVLDQLFNRIVEYNAVTVADFYELCGMTPSFTDDKYGWTDIRGAGILRAHGGFVLDLPRPVPLD